jgi:hypothetical protein
MKCEIEKIVSGGQTGTDDPDLKPLWDSMSGTLWNMYHVRLNYFGRIKTRRGYISKCISPRVEPAI